MAVTLSSREVATLANKDERTIRRWAKSGKLPAEMVLNKFNSPEYFFSLNDLTPDLQEKYYNQLRASLPEASLPEKAKPKAAKPLDTYSIDEQEEIAFWLRLVKRWQDYRNKPGANKTEVDARFVQWCKLEYPERAISVDTLYRRWNAMRANDLDGLIDKRGKWKKGKSSIPDPMWQAFLYFFLDERQHPLKKCYEYPDLDTTEAIIRLTSQNLLTALANTSEEDWQGVSVDKMLREANALVRAAAYKKRVEIQNQDTTEAGLDAVKSLVWEAMAKERPDLYRQVNEFLNSKKQDGLEAR